MKSNIRYKFVVVNCTDILLLLPTVINASNFILIYLMSVLLLKI